MSTIRRALTIVLGAVLASVAVGSATPAAAGNQTNQRPELSVSVEWTHEYENRCSNTAPYACTVEDGWLPYVISVRNRPSPAQPITVGWQIEHDTATGADYSGPSSGSVVIPSDVDWIRLNVPIVDDGVPESTEMLWLRLTSSSVPADIDPAPSIGKGLIYDGGRIPSDCVLAASSASDRSLTCSGRPASQQWRLQVQCMGWTGPQTRFGNIVTGNGRSDVSCDIFEASVAMMYHSVVS